MVLNVKEGTIMTLKWEEVTINHAKILDGVFQLYDQALPKEVRESHDILVKGMDKANTHFPNLFHLLIGLKGKELVSFATFHYLAEVNSGFIVYLITAPNARSVGIGSKTLGKIEELLTKDASQAGNESLKALILETEKEELVHTQEEKIDCVRRNHFYEKNGFKQYKEINYLQPPLNGEDNGVPLHLFLKCLQDTDWTKEEIMKIIYAMYREKYARINGIEKETLNICLAKMGIMREIY